MFMVAPAMLTVFT